MLPGKLLLFSALFFNVVAAFAGPAQERAPNDVFLNLATAYDPLSKCVNKWLASDQVGQQRVPDSISRASGFPAFVSEAEGILGNSHPMVVLADAAGATPAARARYLMAGLGAYAAAMSDDDSLATKIERQRAVALVMINVASVSEGRCEPSQNLTYWMKEASHADH
jgi:hypothetical protein